MSIYHDTSIDSTQKSHTKLATPVQIYGRKSFYEDYEGEHTDISTPGSNLTSSPAERHLKATSLSHPLLTNTGDQFASISTDFPVANSLKVVDILEPVKNNIDSDNAVIVDTNDHYDDNDAATYLLLSDILKTCPQFSFFDEFMKIKAWQNSDSENDFGFIEHSVFDVHKYLTELVLLFENLETIVSNPSPLNKYYNNIEWIFEAKNELSKIALNMDSIDCLISQFLHIIEIKLDEHLLSKNNKEHPIADFEETRDSYLKLLANFDEISDISLHVKKYIIIYKKRIEIATLFNELYVDSLDQISTQIDICLKQGFKLHELKSLSASVQSYSISNLTSIIQSLITNNENISSNNNSRKSSITDWHFSNTSDSNISSGLKKVLPIFSEKEVALYKELAALEALFNPLKTSMGLIKPRILQYCTKEEIMEFYSNSVNDLNSKFKSIERKFHFFDRDITQIQDELIYEKWAKAIEKLINSTEKNLNIVLKALTLIGILHDNPYHTISKHELIPSEIEDQLKAIYKQINLINKLFNLDLIPKQHGVETLETYFTENINNRWKKEFFNRLPSELVYNLFHVQNELSQKSPRFSPCLNQKPTFELTAKDRSMEYMKKYAMQLQLQQQRQNQNVTAKPEQRSSQVENEFFVRSFSLSRSSSSSRVTSPVANDGLFPSINNDKPSDTFNKRRSLTGSLLIGKMHIQPIIADRVMSPKNKSDTSSVIDKTSRIIEEASKNEQKKEDFSCNDSSLILDNDSFIEKNPFMKELEETPSESESLVGVTNKVENILNKLEDLDLETVSEHTPSMIPIATFKSPKRISFFESMDNSFGTLSGGGLSEGDIKIKRRSSSSSYNPHQKSVSQSFINNSFNSEDSMFNDSANWEEITEGNGTTLSERLRKMKRSSSSGIPVPRAILKN